MDITVTNAAKRPTGLDAGATAFGHSGRPFEDTRSPPHSVRITEDGNQGRLRPSGSAVTASGSRVITTRWRSFEERTREVIAETPDNCHVAGVALRNLGARLLVSGRVALDGAPMADALVVTEVAVRCHCIFRAPYEALHHHRPNELIACKMAAYVSHRLYPGPVSLANVASAIGDTRIIFIRTQVNAAIDPQSHEHLVRLRIELSGELVADEMSIVDVTLSVECQTQAHFSTRL
jgi:hypothetical protein